METNPKRELSASQGFRSKSIAHLGVDFKDPLGNVLALRAFFAATFMDLPSIGGQDQCSDPWPCDTHATVEKCQSHTSFAHSCSETLQLMAHEKLAC